MQTSSEFTLTEDEAALKLGITKELLFAYTTRETKRKLYPKRKLGVLRDGQQYKFSSEDLEQWDQFLREPWSESGKDRPPIPSHIVDYLKTESGQCCALCFRGHKLENAHIEDYATSLSHHHHNIIRLCTDCHIKYDEGIISKTEILQTKNSLIQKIRDNIQETILNFSRRFVYRTPNPTSLFVGRETELTLLNQSIENKDRLIIIEGIGGIGKTQLLSKTLSGISDVLTIWFDVESYQSFGDLKLSILQTLSTEGIISHPAGSIFEELCEQSVRLVFDGLDRISKIEWDQARDFFHNLIELTEKPQIIITTQVEFSILNTNNFVLSLTPLTKSESKDLIRSGCKLDANKIQMKEAEIEELVRFCEGHALTLYIVIGLLRYFKNSQVVVARLHTTGAAELIDPTRTQQIRQTSLFLCLQTAYNCFNHEQKRLLQYISNFPGGCRVIYTKHFQDTSAHHINLAELKRFFFVESYMDWWDQERLKLLNPIKQFVRHNWQVHFHEEAASIQKQVNISIMLQAVVIASKHVTSGRTENVQEGLARIDYDFPNYISAFRYAETGVKYGLETGKSTEEYLRIISGLGQALSQYFFIRGAFEQGVIIIESAINASKQLGEYNLTATLYEFLASYQNRIHDIDGLQETATSLLSLAEETSDQYISAQASMTLGDVANRYQRLVESIEHYESAAEFYRNIMRANEEKPMNHHQTQDKRSIAAKLGEALVSIGRSYNDLNKPDKARIYLEEALKYIRQSKNRINYGVIYHQLGNCYSDLGDLNKAMLAYRKALELFVRLGYKEYISNSMGEMGHIVVDLNLRPESEFVFTRDIIALCLDDTAYSIKKALEANPDLTSIHLNALHKLFGVIKLISYTNHADMLQVWSDNLYKEMVKLFQESNMSRKHDELITFFFHYLRLILSLGVDIGKINATDKGYTNERIAELCCLCENFGNYGWSAFKPYEWVAALLRYHHIYPNIDARQLRGAILDAHDMGGHSEFSLEDE